MLARQASSSCFARPLRMGGNSCVASTSRVTLDLPSSKHKVHSSCKACQKQPQSQAPQANGHKHAASSAAFSTSSSAAASSSASTAAAGLTPTHIPLPSAPATKYSTPTPISPTQALSLLAAQQTNLYAIASLAGRTYLLTPRDVLTVPRLNDVLPGDVLHLDRVHEVGSRDYTLRAQESFTKRIGRVKPQEREGRRKAVEKGTYKEEDAAHHDGINASIVAYKSGIPASLAQSHSWLAPILAFEQQQQQQQQEGSSSASTTPSTLFTPTASPSVLQTALQLSLKQSTSSFGAQVSSHGGLAHKGAVLPALIGGGGGEQQKVSSTLIQFESLPADVEVSSGVSASTSLGLEGQLSTSSSPAGKQKPIVQVECTVLEHTKGPLERITKTKRRKGYKRTVEQKQTYTRLRVDAIRLVI